MRRALPLFLLLVGCPEPVATTDGAMSSPSGEGGNIATAPTPGGMGGTPPGDAGMGGPGTATDGAAPSAGTFGSAAPDAELDPRYEQDAIEDAWMVRGTTACSSCSGAILVRVLPPPPDQGGADEEIHLITRKSYDAPGEFEIKVPKRYSTVVLQVVDDADGDGKPSLSEAMGIPMTGPTKVAGDVSDIELVVGVFPEAPAVDATGQALDAPGEVAAPMGDMGGAPPAGGPDGAPPAGGPDGAMPVEGAPPAGGPDGAPVPMDGPPAGGDAPTPEAPAEGG